MKPSTKAELALNGMVQLAKLQPAKPLALSLLAEKQSISLSYLEQVFAALRRNGLVLSVRGPGGGYLLSRSADKITAGEIISAVDAKISKVEPSSTPQDSSALVNEPEEPLRLQQFWSTMSERVVDLYHQVSLQDVVDGSVESISSDQKMAPQAAE